MASRPRLTLCLLVAAAPAWAAPVQEIVADGPSDVAVTVYRAPDRAAGGIDLQALQGFALISETRVVRLPAGESRVRFEGVADGIVSASAIVSGFSGAVIEKNRDARLLSPGSLLNASLGKPLQMVRTNRKTGKIEHITGTLLSSEGGVVFRGPDGIEGLRCSGVPETFSFAPASDLSPRPTLSVRVSASKPVSMPVTLSYLASGFDWAATYSALLSPDGKTMDLGAWITLANSNSVGFAHARAQIVAGRLNKVDDEVEPVALAPPLIATCWPQGNTASGSLPVYLADLAAPAQAPMLMRSLAKASDALQEMVVTSAKRVEQEQLGDLKLYRVPDRTSVASLQMKQVRLMDRSAIPVSHVYTATVSPRGLDADDDDPAAAQELLRTQNTTANHLGLPLPSGGFAVFGGTPTATLLLKESKIRDLALDEEVEISLGTASDVQVATQTQTRTAGREKLIPLVPGAVLLRTQVLSETMRVEISNALPTDIAFELRVEVGEGEQVVRADHPLGKKNGSPVFRLTIPGNGSAAVRFQTGLHELTAVRP
jgi:hypothetical protein